ncbi:MAG: hypothetical protein COA36_04595 [Desulfotalea sp.]|nr:MAG: hypothetical protein COA36_04595 [Desulfotalea sp.]
MQWKLDDIRFLHRPDDFLGSFTNEKMQERHKKMQDVKVKEIHTALANAKLPIEAMNILNPTEHIHFIHNNIDKFKETDTLESTVLKLYYRKNTPFAPSGVYNTWLLLLKLCDRKKLFALGRPFPQDGCVAYRGSLTNIPQGLSWTTDIQEVQWILNRWQDKEMGGGTVYSTTIHPEDILVYVVDAARQEILLKPEIADTIQPDIITSVAT